MSRDTPLSVAESKVKSLSNTLHILKFRRDAELEAAKLRIKHLTKRYKNARESRNAWMKRAEAAESRLRELHGDSQPADSDAGEGE